MTDSNLWGDKPFAGESTYIGGFIGDKEYPAINPNANVEKSKAKQNKKPSKVKYTSRADATAQAAGVTPAPVTPTTIPTNRQEAATQEQEKARADQRAKEESTGGAYSGTHPIRIKSTKVDWGSSLYIGSEGYLVWGGNQDTGNAQEVPIALLGDANGKVIGSSYVQDQNAYGIRTGSPLSFNEATTKILDEYAKKPNGYMELKNELVRLNYLSGADAKASLANGEMYDPKLGQALHDALINASNYNYNAAKKDKRASFLSFGDWLKITNKVYDKTSFGPGGGGAGGTRVSTQKFDAADYDIAIDQLFQQTVGRGASKEELDFFVGQLQSYGDANPQTTVTKVSGDTTTSTTTGGVTAQRAQSMMKEQALSTAGAEQYNKATKYLSYFTDAIDTPIKLG